MKTTAIIPVFNENKTIKNVLQVLNKCKLINEMIIVDDASTDNTLKIIKSLNYQKIKIISLKKNVGKSGAVKIGTKNLATDTLFFCDGDLHNFKQEHIKQILKPFNHKKILMSAGIRDYGMITNFLSKNVYPLITGERALPYSVFKKVVNHPLMEGYGLEVILNDYCKKNKIPISKSIMKGLKQTNKPKKRKNGTYLLIKQSIEIISIMIKLRIKKTWKK